MHVLINMPDRSDSQFYAAAQHAGLERQSVRQAGRAHAHATQVNAMVFFVHCGEQLTGRFCATCGKESVAFAAAQRAVSPSAAAAGHGPTEAHAGAVLDSGEGSSREISGSAGSVRATVAPPRSIAHRGGLNSSQLQAAMTSRQLDVMGAAQRHAESYSPSASQKQQQDEAKSDNVLSSSCLDSADESGLDNGRDCMVSADESGVDNGGDGVASGDGVSKRRRGRPADVKVHDKSFLARCNLARCNLASKLLSCPGQVGTGSEHRNMSARNRSEDRNMSEHVPTPSNQLLMEEFGCSHRRVQYLKKKLDDSSSMTASAV
jgi:hypothetical protein